MDSKAIVKTAITVWSEEDDCYITQSPLAETMIGTGDTEQEAYASFLESVAINKKHYDKGRHTLYRAKKA